MLDLRPVRRDGAFVVVAGPPPGVRAFASIEEDEGPCGVVLREDADAAGLEYDLVLAWITNTADTTLDQVGITAAFSAALGSSGISANVLAGLRHDHVLVPVDRAEDALRILAAL